MSHIITFKPAIKFLEVVTETILNFKQHIEYTGDKTSTTRMALERTMWSVRRLRLLITSTIWRTAMHVYRKTAPRVCSASISDDAVFLIAGIFSTAISAEETVNIYNAKAPVLNHRRKKKEVKDG